MNVDHLLARAGRKIRGKRKPRQTDLRRSVSDIYYAMFHMLARLCANQLVGTTRQNTDSWARIYRSLEHGRAKDELKRTSTQSIDPAIKRFGELFIVLQQERHRADYDPGSFPHGLQQIRTFRDQAKIAISGLDKVTADKKKELAVVVLVKARP